MKTEDLYDYAELNNIEIYDFPLDGHKALSLPLEDGVCAVAMDTYRIPESAVKLALAHELGHCMTHTFYTPSTPMVTRARCENRAKKWAVRHLVSEEQLHVLLNKHREIWEIAEILEVDEETVIQAINLYYCGHL